MNSKVYNVLFLCVGNSARSIMAEAILNRRGRGRFRTFSAGSDPKGEVDPLAIQLLKTFDFPTEGLSSKSWREFARPESPQMDFVISVCDKPTLELPEVLAGNPVRAHWGITDPAAAPGDLVDRKNAFRRAFCELENRISLFILLRHEALEPRTQPAPEAQAL